MNLGQKIIVLGCPGSGKSTFSGSLHVVSGLPLIHLDNVWWKADRSHISREEFDRKLGEILQRDKWILDGDYSRTYEVRFQACDTVFFLDYGLEECMNGIKKRVGKERRDIPWTEQELDPELVKQLMPNASKVRPHVKFTLQMMALTMLILAAARPQYGVREETVTREGVEAVITLDISNSMLAEDVGAGQTSRLDASKQMLSQLMDKMVDDKVGLVVYAGDAFVQLPITCDYVSAKMFLNNIKPDLIQTQGTAIGKALQTSIFAFGDKESAAGRAIILLTDGENFEDDAVEMAEKANKAGIKVIVVGIGSESGSPIPVPGTTEYMKDREGETVVSKLNEDMCRQIAQAGNGIYVHYDSSNLALKAIKKELDKLGKEQLESHVFREYNE